MKRILLADDDDAIVNMLGRVLTAERYEVIVASNGYETIRQFLTGAPDLLLLDLSMPDKDGWEALHFIHSLQASLPTIIITARAHESEQATRMHIDALMEKPLDLPVLLKAIAELLAEPESDRLARRGQPEFQTALLGHKAAARPMPFS